MGVPCEISTPKTSPPVSVCVSKWTSASGPWTAATALTSGSAIEWSPPRTMGIAPARDHLADGPLDRGMASGRIRRDDGGVAEVDHP